MSDVCRHCGHPVEKTTPGAIYSRALGLPIREVWMHVLSSGHRRECWGAGLKHKKKAAPADTAATIWDERP